MKRLFISAGHSAASGQDNGAVSGSNIEGRLTANLRKRLIADLRAIDVEAMIDGDDTVSGQTVKTIQEHIAKIDVAIDIHFNAAGSSIATGTEVLIPFNSSDFEKQSAAKIAKCISETLGIPNRGVKTEAQSARGRLIFMRPNCENILIEVCFISNIKDMEAYHTKKDLLSKNLANLFKELITE